ncbi:MAG: hypothetical protein ABI551_10560 [Polyangiaceae bacterium]
MRALLFTLPVLLSLASCSKAEEAAKEAVVMKLAEKATGGAVKAGELCPNWPKNVPVYPGAKIVACVAFNGPDGGATGSPEMEALIAKREGKPVGDPSPPTTAILNLGLETSASGDDVIAFYKKSLPAGWQYMSTAGQVGVEAGAAWANKTGPDPVYTVMIRQPTKNADGTTSISLMVITVKR